MCVGYELLALTRCMLLVPVVIPALYSSFPERNPERITSALVAVRYLHCIRSPSVPGRGLGLSPIHHLVIMRLPIPVQALLCLALALPVLSHEHGDEVSEADGRLPVDRILWIHIFLQAAVWGVLLPVGMVLGLSRSRWHVPLQVCSTYS